MRMSPARQIERRNKALKELDDMIKDGRAYAKLRQTKTRTAKDYHDKDLRWESMIPYVEFPYIRCVHHREEIHGWHWLAVRTGNHVGNISYIFVGSYAVEGWHFIGW